MQEQVARSLIGLLLFSAGAVAEMYRWEDENGNVIYSQSPPRDDRKASIIKPPPPPPKQKTGVEAPVERATATAGAEANPALDPVLRKKYCETGRHNLELLQGADGTSLFKTETGNEIKMTADEIAIKISESKVVIKAYCDDG